MNAPGILTVHPTLYRAAVRTRRDLESASGRTLFFRSHLTFSDLVEILRRSVLPEKRLASDLALRRMTEDVLSGHGDGGRVSETPPEFLTEAVLALFRRLDLLPPNLRGSRAISALLPSGAKGVWLREVHAAWRKRLERAEWATPGDVLARFTENAGGRPAGLDGVEELRFEGFVDPAPLEREAMAAFSAWLPTRFDFELLHARPDLFSPLEPLLNRIEKTGAIGHAAPEVAFVEPLLAADENRLAAVDAFFPAVENVRTPGEVPFPDPRIRLFRPADLSAQVRLAAFRIRKALAEGMDPADMAVVVPDLERLRTDLRRAILEDGLPIAYHRSVSVLDAPCLGWMRRLYDVLSGEVSIAELAALARSARPFGLGPETRSDEMLETAEALMGRRGVELLEERDWKRAVSMGVRDETEREALEALEAWRTWLSDWRKRRTPEAWIERILKELDRLRLPFYRSVHERRRFVLGHHALETARRILEEWRSEVAGEAAETDVRLSASLFLSRLFRLLDLSIRLRSGPEPETVAVLGPEEAAEAEYRRIFLLDLNDGIFPKLKENPGMLAETERHRINRAAGGILLPGLSNRFFRERMQFVRMLTKCGEVELYVPVRDADGKELSPSPFIAKAMAAMETENETAPPDPPAERLRAAAAWAGATANDAAAADFADENGAETLLRLVEKARIGKRRDAFLRDFTDDRRAERADAHTGNIDPDVYAAYDCAPSCYSSSAFEDYADCPFKYFANRVLKAEPWQTEPEALDAREAGAALHRVMMELLRDRLDEIRNDPDRAEMLAFTRLKELFGADSDMLPERRRRIAELEAGRWAGRIRRYFERWGADFDVMRPIHFEKAFGDGGADSLLPDLSITDEHGAFRICGRLDRVDVGVDGRLRVVDYKSGGRESVSGKLDSEQFGRSSFQMPVYMLALAQAVKNNENKDDPFRIHARYELLKEPEKPRETREPLTTADGGFLDIRPGEDETGDRNLAGRLADMVRAMRAGRFAVAPRTCRYCPFATVCRIRNYPKPK